MILLFEMLQLLLLRTGCLGYKDSLGTGNDNIARFRWCSWLGSQATKVDVVSIELPITVIGSSTNLGSNLEDQTLAINSTVLIGSNQSVVNGRCTSAVQVNAIIGNQGIGKLAQGTSIQKRAPGDLVRGSVKFVKGCTDGSAPIDNYLSVIVDANGGELRSVQGTNDKGTD